MSEQHGQRQRQRHPRLAGHDQPVSHESSDDAAYSSPAPPDSSQEESSSGAHQEEEQEEESDAPASRFVPPPRATITLSGSYCERVLDFYYGGEGNCGDLLEELVREMVLQLEVQFNDPTMMNKSFPWLAESDQSGDDEPEPPKKKLRTTPRCD